MAKNGWEFIEPARRRDARFVRACVRIDDVFGEIPIAELRGWLERMEFLDEPVAAWVENPGPTPPGRTFDFQIWASDGRLWYAGADNGVAMLKWLPATPEAWLHELRTSPYELGLSEMPARIRSRIVRAPGVMSGDPVVEGTRVSATTVVAEIFAGASEASIHEGYPSLPAGAVQAAIDWAVKELGDYRRAFLVREHSVEQTPEIVARHVDDMRKRGLESSLELGPRIERNLLRLIGDRPDVVVMDGGPVSPPDTLIDAQLRLEEHYRDPAIVTILMYVVDTREIVIFRKGITKIITERYGTDDDEIYVAKGLVVRTADIWDLDHDE